MKEKYYTLIEILKLEAESNIENKEFLEYMLRIQNKFTTEEGVVNNVTEIRSFLRGANRFADEFKFSDERRSIIKRAMNDLFESLSSNI